MRLKRSDFLKLAGLGTLSGFLPSLKFTTDPSTESEIIKPPKLKKGDTIGLISPGFILPEESLYDEIAETIKSRGFNVKIGRYARDRYGYLAGEDRKRADDLNTMFADDEVDAIIPFRGGWGSNRILSLIDYDIIRQNPKPIIGFSDITALLLAIHAKTGLVTFHGPVGKSEWNDFTFRYFKSVLMGQGRVIYKNPASRQVNTINEGKATGRLFGGNLTVITSLIGSGYLNDFEGAILFVEDVGEDFYRIDRMLTQLKLSGILDRINGFIFGDCTNCKPGRELSLSLEEILNDHIGSLGIPAFYGSMIGHIDEIFTLPIGIQFELDASEGTFGMLDVPTR